MTVVIMNYKVVFLVVSMRGMPCYYLEFVALQHLKVFLEAELPSHISLVADEIFAHEKCSDIICCPSERFN